MTKQKPSQGLYIVFGVIIAVLIALIGYFAYLLIAPSDDTNTTTNTAVTNTSNKNNSNTNSNKNKNSNTNKNSNANSNTNAEGLVEPNKNNNDNSNTNSNTNNNTNSATTDEATDEVVAGEGEKVITLYFPKTGAACGEVTAVKRAVTPDEDDFYGQIMLADLAGPTAEETGYDNAAAGVRLRWVEYTSEGSIVYVNEAYNELSDCDQQTAEAQLIHTANAMFDVSPTATGEVIVGYPDEDEDTNTNSGTNDNSNDNTNTDTE
jgi:hypothetical protein